jgi:hypothetical protein
VFEGTRDPHAASGWKRQNPQPGRRDHAAVISVGSCGSREPHATPGQNLRMCPSNASQTRSICAVSKHALISLEYNDFPTILRSATPAMGHRVLRTRPRPGRALHS